MIVLLHIGELILLTTVAITPMMKTGAGSQYTLVRSRSRAVMPPILIAMNYMNYKVKCGFVRV